MENPRSVADTRDLEEENRLLWGMERAFHFAASAGPTTHFALVHSWKHLKDLEWSLSLRVPSTSSQVGILHQKTQASASILQPMR